MTGNHFKPRAAFSCYSCFLIFFLSSYTTMYTTLRFRHRNWKTSCLFILDSFLFPHKRSSIEHVNHQRHQQNTPWLSRTSRCDSRKSWVIPWILSCSKNSYQHMTLSSCKCLKDCFIHSRKQNCNVTHTSIAEWMVCKNKRIRHSKSMMMWVSASFNLSCRYISKKHVCTTKRHGYECCNKKDGMADTEQLSSSIGWNVSTFISLSDQNKQPTFGRRQITLMFMWVIEEIV